MKYNPNRGRCFSGAEIAAYRARQRIRQMQRQQQIREMAAARKQSTVKKTGG